MRIVLRFFCECAFSHPQSSVKLESFCTVRDTLALKLLTGACEAQKELKDDGSVEEVAGEQHLMVQNMKS